METVSNFIQGAIASSNSQRYAAVYNPATGEQIRQVVMSDKAEVEQAIASAAAAFPAWSKHSPLRRARVLFRFKALLEERMDTLARLISQEHGKVYSDAVGEVTRGLEVVEFACGIPHLQKGEHSANVGTGVDSHSLMQPLGVCVGITPFNFPAMVPMWMFPIALATGNTFVLKPSEKDPSLSLLLAQLLKEAGLPDGVFNVVQGDKEAVDVLLTDPRVQAVSFVGSTPVAEYIYQTASAHGKRCQALGGAKNHCILMPDADMDMAASAIMGAAFGAAGERCMALSVVVAVGDDTADALNQRLNAQINAMRVGPGLVDGQENEMGPVISAPHRAKIADYIQSGVDQGATLRIDGRTLSVQGHQQGYFIGPTLFDNVTPEMKIYQEEIFGPVLSVVRVPDYQTAVTLINNHEYGNGTAIFTRDGETARQFCEEVQAGMVGVNVPIPVPMAFHSFGGWKRSIFGPLNVHGNDGVRFYTRMKTVTSRWPASVRLEHHASSFIMPTLE
ncbi:CoA-acylating methylmalonate-semialdehyde dehydrogenase [Pectobacterium aroidearum]|jgi:malonate-semialdehyde dehydrogenase (acetylating)/methylmalonate-semialdehyde dehydrogenase|uniref:CoA-acylating methylmalonate-semialdehyde dehydrogenase n=1 Tax=Pectobacterium aroidearum TaxID=1201031 RepID=UPI0018DA9696|nr:CoA-acylating methylmalonate-semialdehyde dehydrogenase [Pectobacterium aroidearum]QPI41834.1 CoA-acylating methylmalonate-semialdehyde dehydrogenase [Pectobacterium aroidearum]UUE43750.1 CoA-acylating methylmalonate-semialdehyde dehydrogenase [Pectobacterium aroidearum]UUE47971.1 CoA-acylating methylmalonate-semialdehyde dehydrogenase [Pectobacterium aroidearum]UUE52176.1 CoA-acylating methylmalonate-semialdehyde dehydrogenase [Pectobacterium aroidearum]UUE60584.1 CoA-acylating methylmalon